MLAFEYTFLPSSTSRAIRQTGTNSYFTYGQLEIDRHETGRVLNLCME